MDSSDGSQRGEHDGQGEIDLLLRRIDGLESRVAILEASHVETAQVAPAQRAVPPPPRPQDAVSTAARPEVDPASGPTGLVAAARSNPLGAEPLLRWAGIALLFLAAAFLVSTAVSRGWIGPELQFAGAGALGVALLWWSSRIRVSSRPWSLAAAHGGSAVLGVTAFAGWDGLDLYGRPVALVLTVVVVAVTAGFAVLIGRASVAVSSAFISVLLPVALDAPDSYPWWASSLWLLAVVAGFTALGVERRWASLRILVLVITAIPLLALSSEIADRGRTIDLVIGLGVAVAAIATFIAGPVVARARFAANQSIAPDEGADPPGDLDPGSDLDSIRYENDRLIRSIDQRLIATLPPFAWLLVGLMLVPEDDSRPYILAFGVAAVFAVVLAGLRRVRAMSEAMLLAGVVGVSVLISIGFAGLLDGPALLVAIAAQAIGFGWLAARFDDVFLRINAGVLGLIAAVWTAGELIEAIDRGATIGEHLANLFVVVSIAGLVVLLRHRPYVAPAALVAWIGWLAWLAAVLGELPQGQVAVSISWALCGAIALLYGLSGGRQRFAQVGLVTLAVTVLKLVSIDLEAVDTMWRAGLFFVVGLGLLRLGLLVGSSDHDTDTEAVGEPQEMAPR